ncbi:MAG: acyl carrier protein, partial [Acetobacterium sp.]|nr:acyl carrier protein [Acetobacterium sp.]
MDERFLKVTAIISEQLDVDIEKITLETSLIDDLEADSLDVVELIMAFEDEFGT